MPPCIRRPSECHRRQAIRPVDGASARGRRTCPLAKRAGILRGVKPYEARHTTVNVLHWRGVPDASIAALVGNSVKILRKYYLQELEPDNPSNSLVADAFRQSLRVLNGGRPEARRRTR